MRSICPWAALSKRARYWTSLNNNVSVNQLAHNLSRRTNFIAATISGLVVLAGCAAPVDKPDESGFLSDYSKLEMKEKGDINYLSDRASEYDSFIIEPVEILFDRHTDDPVFTDEEIDEIKKYFVDEMTEALTKGDDAYKIVTATGPGVARIRIDITELDETIGALNVTIYTKVTGLGLVVS